MCPLIHDEGRDMIIIFVITDNNGARQYFNSHVGYGSRSQVLCMVISSSVTIEKVDEHWISCTQDVWWFPALCLFASIPDDTKLSAKSEIISRDLFDGSSNSFLLFKKTSLFVSLNNVRCLIRIHRTCWLVPVHWWSWYTNYNINSYHAHSGMWLVLFHWWSGYMNYNINAYHAHSGMWHTYIRSIYS